MEKSKKVPNLVRSMERTSPTGPAPTIKTGRIPSSSATMFLASEKLLLDVNSIGLVLVLVGKTPFHPLIDLKNPMNRKKLTRGKNVLFKSREQHIEKETNEGKLVTGIKVITYVGPT